MIVVYSFDFLHEWHLFDPSRVPKWAGSPLEPASLVAITSHRLTRHGFMFCKPATMTVRSIIMTESVPDNL